MVGVGDVWTACCGGCVPDPYSDAWYCPHVQFCGVSLRTRPTVHFPSACVVLVSYSRFIGVFLFFFFLSLFFDIESWMLGGFKGGYPVALP